ncbi:MAG: tetratricopeptide repeat protein [Oscillospiraceae bacterium]|nr:tetratricopeptide repeat protein [Oscillospiraceae bacterium]
MRDNILSYESLGWVLEKSEAGFYLLVASPRMQAHVVKHYLGPGVAALDFLSEKRQGYYFTAVASLLAELPPETRTVFFLNFQAVLFEDDDLKRLNFSRDMLSRLRKNLIFCVTPAGQDRIIRGALDFQSFVELTFSFEDELPETDTVIHLERTRWLPQDQSTGVTVQIDWTWPKARLLARAISLNNEARTFRSENRFSDARELLQNAVRIREELLGPEHLETASLYHNLAVVNKFIGSYDKALEYDQKALHIREKILGKDHTQTANIYSQLASIYKELHNYPKALEFHLRALECRERVLGPSHPDTIRSYNSLATIYKYMGDFNLALYYAKLALDFREKVLGNDSPDTAVSCNSLADIYRSIYRYEEAFKYTEQALAINKETLGICHPNTAATYKNLAELHQETGNYAKSLECYWESLKISEQALGPDHPKRAEIYFELARIYHDITQYDEALFCIQCAVDIFEKALGAEHPNTLVAKQCLDIIQRSIQKTNETLSDSQADS